MATIGLVIVCGIPGSGKSNLCRKLSELGTRNNIRYVHVEYDALLPSDVEKQLIEDDNVSSQWKSYRRCIRVIMEKYIQELQSGTVINERDNAESRTSAATDWNLSCSQLDAGILADLQNRFHALCQIPQQRKQPLPQQQQTTCAQKQESQPSQKQDAQPVQQQPQEQPHQQQSLPPTPSSEKLILLLDDNMYYSSMRYQYYQLARKYCIGFGQIYVRCDTATTVIERNRCRPHEHRVAEEVIIGMATKFEVPSDLEWEQNSLTISPSDEQKIDYKTIESFFTDIVFAKPIRATEDKVDPEMQQQSRLACTTSILHQSDRILRHLVSETVTTVQGKAEEKRRVAKKANRARTLVMERLKQEEIEVSEQDVAEAAANQMDGQLCVLVKGLFEEFIKM